MRWKDTVRTSRLSRWFMYGLVLQGLVIKDRTLKKSLQKPIKESFTLYLSRLLSSLGVRSHHTHLHTKNFG